MMRLRVAPTMMPSITKGMAAAKGMAIIQPIYCSATLSNTALSPCSGLAINVKMSRHQPTYTPINTNDTAKHHTRQSLMQ